MDLTLNTFPGFGFFRPANSGATRKGATRSHAALALNSSQQLQKGTTLTIDQAVRAEVFCLEGTLWITHDGSGKDIVIEAGERYIASNSARMLVHALEYSQLRLV